MTKKDLIVKKMRKKMSTLFFDITGNCNLHCRHCIRKEDRSNVEPDPRNILNWISQVPDTEYKNINFIGGEPFLCLKNLQTYIKNAAERQISTAVTTNAYWASTEQKAREVLHSLPGLKTIFISSDIYHLEFVEAEVVNNLVNVCLDLGIFVVINATCSSKDEGEKIKDIYRHFKNKVQINICPLFPEGGAKNLNIEQFKYLHEIEGLPDICSVRDHYISQSGRVDACCIATIAFNTNYLFLGDLRYESLKEIIRKRRRNLLFNFMDHYGPRGLGKLVLKSRYYKELKESGFTSECDFCYKILNNLKYHQYIYKILEKKYVNLPLNNNTSTEQIKGIEE